MITKDKIPVVGHTAYDSSRDMLVKIEAVHHLDEAAGQPESITVHAGMSEIRATPVQFEPAEMLGLEVLASVQGALASVLEKRRRFGGQTDTCAPALLRRCAVTTTRR
jgi:hypothetical protein